MMSELRLTVLMVVLMSGLAAAVTWAATRSATHLATTPPTAATAAPAGQPGSAGEPVCPHCKQSCVSGSTAGSAEADTGSTILFTVGARTIRAEHLWLAVGLVGQFFFGTRFFLQWLVSERRGESVVPMSFWWLSLVAGLMVLAYGLYKLEPVIILSQLFNPVIYIRNIVLIQRKQRREELLASMGTADSDKPTEEKPAAA